ncbi:hypothetical protein [Brevibacillus laterosporus]|uniref:hypothetical protein n=1 Tax=Brevibacillus laterosporus TaxID=1465 RepID=UPI003D1EFE99
MDINKALIRVFLCTNHTHKVTFWKIKRHAFHCKALQDSDVIIPNYNEFNELTQRDLKKVIEMCLQDEAPLDEIFEMRSMPFEKTVQIEAKMGKK